MDIWERVGREEYGIVWRNEEMDPEMKKRASGSLLKSNPRWSVRVDGVFKTDRMTEIRHER